nr:MAG TPA: hypothetical protein [Caudoviricetes sp.]
MVGRVRITHFFGFELFFLKPEKNAGRRYF